MGTYMRFKLANMLRGKPETAVDFPEQCSYELLAECDWAVVQVFRAFENRSNVFDISEVLSNGT